MSIIAARIDNRLLHGIVATQWVPEFRPQRLMVIDDIVANDPTKRKAPAVAEVRHGPAGVAQAKLLQSTLPKGTVLFADKRKGATVDVALGAKYTVLAPAATASGLPTCPAPSAS